MVLWWSDKLNLWEWTSTKYYSSVLQKNTLVEISLEVLEDKIKQSGASRKQWVIKEQNRKIPYFLITNRIRSFARSILSRRGMPYVDGRLKGIPSGSPSTYKSSTCDWKSGYGIDTGPFAFIAWALRKKENKKMRLACGSTQIICLISLWKTLKLADRQ